MLALLYPGQGAQSTGFLHRLPAHPVVSATLAEASDALSLDVLTLDSSDALRSSVAVQISLVVAGVAIQRRLEAKLVGRQRLDGGQARGLQRHLDAPALARGELLTEQGFNRLQCGELTALDTLHGVLQVFERAGHLQAHQMTANALQ